MKKRIKVNFKDLENYISEAVEKQIKEKEGSKKTVITTKKQLRSMIETLINEKLTGNAFNEMHELKNMVLREIQKITKSKWALCVSNIGKKSDGSYIIKIVGSGNTKVNLVWGANLDGDFNFSTGTPLVAGDEFSTDLYSFMISMVEKKNDIVKILKDIEMKIITDDSEEITEDDTEDMGMGDGMGMGMGIGASLETAPMIDDPMASANPMGETPQMGNEPDLNSQPPIEPDMGLDPLSDMSGDDDEVELTYDDNEEMPPLPEPESIEPPVENPENKLEKPIEKPKNAKI